MPFSAPFIGVSRNRLTTDGFGVTTLAAFWGCSLDCRYCLNPQCKDENPPAIFTVEELYHHVRKDDLYFLATGGGVTFGGGEPCLYPDFITSFRAFCGTQWNITLETGLHVPLENIETLYSVVDDYIVDIKDMNLDIYKRYTGKDNELTVRNLKWLVEQGKADRITVRVPRIPDFNTEQDIENSIRKLKELGITKMDIFAYIIKTSKDESRKKNL